MIIKGAAILFLIALSGCTEKVDASDPPAVGLAADPGTYGPAKVPPEIVANSPPVAESPSGAESEPPMRSPVQLD